MRPYIRLFGPAHLAILAAIPSLAAVLALIHRRLGPGSRTLRLALAAVLLSDTVVFYTYLIRHRLFVFPGGLPLELCDFALVLSFLALLTLDKTIFDIAYYLALGGSSMALLTPNLWEPFPSFGTVQFFVAHGLTVAGVLFLLWSGQARPRPGSVSKAMLAINLVAIVVGTFDYLYGTNYMYLRAKPASVSLMNLLGPWPWYIASCELVALCVFALLYLPYRSK
jgi:hypothetical integral membrane protein (TIGR02206 family)